jgi:serine/threonine protein kinase
MFSKAPEALNGYCNVKSDVWSLGISAFYLLEDNLPFDKETV